MPMYDYKCENCGHQFEELVFSSSVADKEIKCPQCDERKSRRQLCAPMVVVKGGGSIAPAAPCGAPGGFT